MLRTHRGSDDGLGLVELVIAMFLLAIITLAILPALLSGVRNAAVQSTTATATRQLNALVEQARESPSCSALSTAAASHSYQDGAGHTFTTSGTVGPCSSGTTATIHLTAVDSGGVGIAKVDAVVYVP